jgi:Bifunctional DNA primase/polymerase, N-terminal
MSLGDAALRLARNGLRVFPCRERSKEPLIHDNLKRATTDANIIKGWWHGRNYNIAIVTGPDSGVWCLDIDGDEGEATLRQMEAEHGALPATIEAITGKGRHLYFRWPTGIEIRNAQCRDDLPGLDWRGNGGYVLAPPSIHPSGRQYSWSVDSADEYADAPDWLIDVVTSKQTGEVPATPPEAWRSFIEDTYEGSHRGAAIARLAGLLLRRYIDPYVALSLCQQFNMLHCREPLTWGEVIRIVNDIAHREADRREKMGG